LPPGKRSARTRIDKSDRFARRVATFDRHALADIKHFVNNVSLPADAEYPL
jgi:hypothetical protein